MPWYFVRDNPVNSCRAGRLPPGRCGDRLGGGSHLLRAVERSRRHRRAHRRRHRCRRQSRLPGLRRGLPVHRCLRARRRARGQPRDRQAAGATAARVVVAVAGLAARPSCCARRPSSRPSSSTGTGRGHASIGSMSSSSARSASTPSSTPTSCGPSESGWPAASTGPAILDGSDERYLVTDATTLPREYCRLGPG